jgi:glycolate oxidase iron-sulfur subunit
MSFSLPVAPSPLRLDPRTYDRALSCVHCGLCLPACPTYLQTGHEAQSPRGRIQLIRGLSDGTVRPTASVLGHLDACLDCRGCETACPSSVVYHELIEEMRDRLAHRPQSTPGYRPDAMLRWITLNILTNPLRMKLALLPARLLQRAGLWEVMRRLRLFELLPPSLARMERLLPPDGALWPESLPEQTADGLHTMLEELHRITAHQSTEDSALSPRTTVGFFAGCVGSVLFNRLNRQAIDLLSASGTKVYAPRRQGCCGAIHQHSGEATDARAMARRNIDLFIPRGKRGVDFIVTHISGCGSTLKEYEHLLRDDPHYASRAREFSTRVLDISQMLVELKLPHIQHEIKLTAAFHDACHLIHAQKVTASPRELLGRIPGLKLVPLRESDICCGAAGTYNLTHPKMAADLAERKLANFLATGAEAIVTGNIGCAMHLQAQARSKGREVAVLHPIELLHQAIFGTGRRSKKHRSH